MKLFEQIKDERAYEMEYSDWQDFIYSIDDPDIVDTEFNEVSNRFAKEVAREALKNANARTKDTLTEFALKREGNLSMSLEGAVLSDKNIPEL